MLKWSRSVAQIGLFMAAERLSESFPRFFSALNCFSALSPGLNAERRGDKTPSLKMFFVTT